MIADRNLPKPYQGQKAPACRKAHWMLWEMLRLPRHPGSGERHIGKKCLNDRSCKPDGG
jgi:hypothetical protein